MQSDCFSYKNVFLWKESATNFVVQKLSARVVRHALVYLTVRKWLMGDVLFYLKLLSE